MITLYLEDELDEMAITEEAYELMLLHQDVKKRAAGVLVKPQNDKEHALLHELLTTDGDGYSLVSMTHLSPWVGINWQVELWLCRATPEPGGIRVRLWPLYFVRRPGMPPENDLHLFDVEDLLGRSKYAWFYHHKGLVVDPLYRIHEVLPPGGYPMAWAVYNALGLYFEWPCEELGMTTEPPYVPSGYTTSHTTRLITGYYSEEGFRQAHIQVGNMWAAPEHVGYLWRDNHPIIRWDSEDYVEIEDGPHEGKYAHKDDPALREVDYVMVIVEE